MSGQMRVPGGAKLSNTAAIANKPCRSDPRAITQMGENWLRGEQTPEQSATRPLRGVGMGKVTAGRECKAGLRDELDRG